MRLTLKMGRTTEIRIANASTVNAGTGSSGPWCQNVRCYPRTGAIARNGAGGPPLR